ncbi:phenylacetate--CoA ligase family protein [Candidatus Accumulibacter phosphatis]|uniref:Capsular polysaccharide biosynthesis protein n=1 Tax=Candidatus Accumulibacter phosphatis TaxID=327160 RepID=A0A5S4EQN8_9PROT|nr:phenylacetate--CoA ligase family protein [Candidatus Accumulibacter phosphatis]TMQ77790.1 capsular polysaccharide biosynthesis protein [Candidatus Accumulibacter phosphatis]
MALMKSRFGWDEKRIRAYQEERLRSIIGYCWEHVPYYRSHWTGSIKGPEDIRSIEDLQRLPLLTKADVRENQAALTTTDPRVKSTLARTGGSTGQPVIFRMTQADEQLAWAQMYIGWAWAGWRLGDPFLVVGGESVGVGKGDNRTRNDKLMNRWVSSGSNITRERTLALVASPQFKRIRLIYGYPNSIRELCEHLADLGVRPPALQGVICTAEVMRQEVRDRIAKVLGVTRVLDQYGLNDGGLHACEGPEQNGLHLSFHRGALEILDDQNRQITDLNVTGRAVATTLTNLATPFIRYETGDRLHWHSKEPSPNGVHWPRIGPVDGRTGDVIHLTSGRSIAMPGLTLVMRWIDGLTSYQFIQTGPDAVTVRVQRADSFSMTEAQLVEYLSQHIAEEIGWTIEWGAPELTRNGKLLIVRNDWLQASQGGNQND